MSRLFHFEYHLVFVNSYLLTPWCRFLLEQLTGLQLVKKFPAFHGTRRFITALTSVRHLSLSWAIPPDCFVSRASIPHVSVSEQIFFKQRGVVSTSPNPQAGGPPLVGCLRLLIQFIRNYSPYRRPFLYPQPEDAPCRGDGDPLHGFFVNTLPIFLPLKLRYLSHVSIVYC